MNIDLKLEEVITICNEIVVIKCKQLYGNGTTKEGYYLFSLKEKRKYVFQTDRETNSVFIHKK